MTEFDDLIGRIDALVDWQLTQSPAALAEHQAPTLPAHTGRQRVVIKMEDGTTVWSGWMAFAGVVNR